MAPLPANHGMLQVPCPACYSTIGEDCTHPTPNGRAYVKWVHLAREDALGDLARYAPSKDTDEGK